MFSVDSDYQSSGLWLLLFTVIHTDLDKFHQFLHFVRLRLRQFHEIECTDERNNDGEIASVNINMIPASTDVYETLAVYKKVMTYIRPFLTLETSGESQVGSALRSSVERRTGWRMCRTSATAISSVVPPHLCLLTKDTDMYLTTPANYVIYASDPENQVWNGHIVARFNQRSLVKCTWIATSIDDGTREGNDKKCGINFGGRTVRSNAEYSVLYDRGLFDQIWCLRRPSAE